MKFSFLLRVVMLTIAFLGTVMVMMQLKERGLGSAMEGFLGIEGPQQTTVARVESKPEKMISWCKTRVKSINLKNFGRVYQEGMKWYFQSADASTGKPINFLDFEKWFVRHCKMEVRFTPDQNHRDREEFLNVEFIKGKPMYFSKGNNGYFSWMRSGMFHSPQLEKAIQEFKKIMSSSE